MIRNYVGMCTHMLGQGGFSWMLIIPMIAHLLLWAVVLYMIVKLVRSHKKRAMDMKPTEGTALAILRERYAKGEIDFEEFQQRKEGLQ